ncbi:MAG: class IV adenylate cyclase [Vicinamibacteria bacterium]
MSSSRKPASNPVETEAKISVRSFAPIKRGIVAAGGRLINARALEINTLFDDLGGSLRSVGKSFRVRRYGDQGVVTLKGPATVRDGLKSRMELETEVRSPDRLAQILGELGFGPIFRYEKFREVWRVGSALLCLDETPLGNFVEIEGTVSVIRRVAAKLGVASSRFLSTSYPMLWLGSGRKGDMVFAKRRAAPTKAKAKAKAKGTGRA